MAQFIQGNESIIQGTFMGDYLNANANIDEAIYLDMDNILYHAFLDTAQGEYLDMIGQQYGLTRLLGTKAEGDVDLTFLQDFIVPQGSLFTTTDLLQYETVQVYTAIGGTPVRARLRAMEAGTRYNIPTDVVLNVVNFIPNLQRVTRVNAFQGGSDPETDDAYRARIYDYVRSYTGAGTKHDYEVWAKQVSGVFYADVIPLWNGNGTVKVIISGEHGEELDATIVKNAQDYISPQTAMGMGVAPIGADVTVVSVVNTDLASFTIKGLVLSAGADEDTVKANILTALQNAILNVMPSETIYRQRIESVLAGVNGVQDFDYIWLNGTDYSNIVGDQSTKYVLNTITYTA